MPIIYVSSKNIKNFLLKIFNNLQFKKNLYITWACFRYANSHYVLIPDSLDVSLESASLLFCSKFRNTVTVAIAVFLTPFFNGNHQIDDDA